MCGEKKSFANSIEMELGSPPHVRGKGTSVFRYFFHGRITPACAGKSTQSDIEIYRVPGSPPHVRGKACFRTASILAFRITPACAGKRVEFRYILFDDTGSPPHVRGKVVFLEQILIGFGITPACAGKRTFDSFAHTADWDHPRMCGEKLFTKCSRYFHWGSPPHVRGKD